MKPLGDLLQNRKFVFTKQEQTEYGDLVKQASKFVGQPYIAVHKRLERAFVELPTEYMFSKLRMWVAMASKANNAGIVFNGEFKKWRDKQTTV